MASKFLAQEVHLRIHSAYFILNFLVPVKITNLQLLILKARLHYSVKMTKPFFSFSFNLGN